MVKYVYYNPATMQVMAEFETPNLSQQVSWEAKGYMRAVIPPGLNVTRDHKITGQNADGSVRVVVSSVNPAQPDRTADIERASLKESVRAKLLALGLTTEDISVLIP